MTLPWTFTYLPDGFNKNSLAPLFSKFINTDMGAQAKKDLLQGIQDATNAK